MPDHRELPSAECIGTTTTSLLSHIHIQELFNIILQEKKSVLFVTII